MNATVRFCVEHIRREMMTSVASGFDAMKEEVLAEIRAQASEDGYKEAIRRTVKEELNAALRDEARSVVRKALEKHRPALEAAVFERLTELVSKDEIGKTLAE